MSLISRSTAFSETEREFIEKGTRTAKLAWVGDGGRPLVAPVWFVVEDDEVVFVTGLASSKGRAVFRDPRLTFSVDLEEPPYGFVQAQCEVVRTDTDADELIRCATKIARRYMGPDRAEEYGHRNGADGEVMVRLRVVKVVSAFDTTL